MIRIKTNPTKLVYGFGENFDPNGLVLEKVNKDGSVSTITDFTIEDGNNLKMSSQVYAVYEDLYVEIPIEVEERFVGQITLVGDSLTQGHYWKDEAYPNYISANLPEGSNATISNCGKDGASFKTFGQYNPAYNTQPQYQTSLTGNPSVLTILLGTNDSTNWQNEKDDFYDDYSGLINTYKETFGDDLNIICITSPKTTTNEFGIQGDIIVNTINPLQREIAEELDCYLLDFSDEVKDMPFNELTRDGVHLTKSAAELLAKDIADLIVEIYE